LRGRYDDARTLRPTAALASEIVDITIHLRHGCDLAAHRNREPMRRLVALLSA
jgi:hypothetical protein